MWIIQSLSLSVIEKPSKNVMFCFYWLWWQHPTKKHTPCVSLGLCFLLFWLIHRLSKELATCNWFWLTFSALPFREAEASTFAVNIPWKVLKEKPWATAKKKTSHVKPSLKLTFYFIAPENGWLEADPASFLGRRIFRGYDNFWEGKSVINRDSDLTEGIIKQPKFEQKPCSPRRIGIDFLGNCVLWSWKQSRSNATWI